MLHIELRRWADMLLIAPLDANTLAKLAHGLADNLLSSLVRAWDVGAKPVIVAPAMNTLMWQHPLTARQLGELAAPPLNFRVVPPVSKRLACADVGIGAMADLDALVDAVLAAAAASQSAPSAPSARAP